MRILFIKLLVFFYVTVSLTQRAQSVTTYSFFYTGAQATFTVPSCVTSLSIACAGASGRWGSSTAYQPGSGSYVAGVITVTPGDVFYLYVGGYNGYNGGGGSNGFYNGGGATDVRYGGNTLSDRILVAGGSGGGGGDGHASSSILTIYQGGAGGGFGGVTATEQTAKMEPREWEVPGDQVH